MSGIPDDRFSENPATPNWLIEAKTAVRLPATLLIMIGILGLLMAILFWIQLGSSPAKFDMMIAEVEADPRIPQDEKDKQIDFLTACKDTAESRTAIIAYYSLNIVSSFLVVIGGINMLRLSGPTVPTAAAVLTMLPCVLGCCGGMGLPAGIWALVVLNRPDVRAAMARNSFDENADDYKTR